jgi:hypothetical protein
VNFETQKVNFETLDVVLETHNYDCSIKHLNIYNFTRENKFFELTVLNRLKYELTTILSEC